MENETPNYDDIIDLPHHSSKVHPRMSMLNRAAQFSPFAALTGYGDAIDETARLTQQRVELSEAELKELNDKLARATKRLPARAAVTYFVPDPCKDGGRYVTRTVVLRQVLPSEGRLALEGGESIELDCVIDIEPCVK